MIKVINGHALSAGIEAAQAAGDFECDLRYAELSPEEQTTYNNGFAVLSPSTICNVENAPNVLEISRMTSSAINEGADEISETTLDYNTLSAGDKLAVDNLIQLLIDKCW